jgi:hypothetical protein
MARRHGSHGQILIDPTGGALPVIVASMNGWTLDLARDKVDVTAFGDSFKQYVQGLPDIKGTIKGWWDAAASRSLFSVALGETAVTLKLFPSSLDASDFFQGPAYLDTSIEVAADGAVSLSGNFAGAGNWTTPGAVVATGATAGTPGTFTPAGSIVPANLAAMTGKTASPNTAWTTGQHVVLGDASKSYWNGTAWVVGQAAVE